MRVSIFYGNSLLRCESIPTPLEIFVTISLICGFHVKLLSMLTPRNFVCVEKGIVTTFIFYQTFIDSQDSLTRVKKHGNCFVYVKFVGIESFSYFRNFLIHSIYYRFWIQIFIKNISVVSIK